MLALEEVNLTGVRNPQAHEGSRRDVSIPQKPEALRTIAMPQAPSPFHFTSVQCHLINFPLSPKAPGLSP